MQNIGRAFATVALCAAAAAIAYFTGEATVAGIVVLGGAVIVWV